MRRKYLVGVLAVAAVTSMAVSAHANQKCNPITAAALTLVAADCNQAKVWSTLQASGQFPDVFAPPAKTLPICYVSQGPAPAQIGQHNVTITSTMSSWTTDFVPVLFGGTDNLGTVITQLNITDSSGNFTGKLYTRDTIDLSQIFVTGTAPEEDVIVGGSNNFGGAKGTYRLDSVANADASVVSLSNLHGVVCSENQ